MATRFWLGNTAAGYTPATPRGAWDDTTSTLARRLAPAPEGTAATVALAEVNAANDYDGLLGRWVSDAALTAGTLSGTAAWVAGVAESDLAANLVWHVHIYVTAGDTSTVRGTVLTDSIGATEWTATATGRGEGAKALSSVAVSVGDRLVVELGYRAQNTSTSSFTGTLHYGNTGAADLAQGATSVTTDPGWIELSGADGIFYPQISTLADTFDGPAFSPVWNGSYGAVDITAGRGRVPCAHIGGSPQYAAIYSTPASQELRWHFADSAIYCEAPLVPGANGGLSAVYSHFAVTAAANISGSYAGVFYNAVANVLVLQSATGFSDAFATYIPYDPIAHRWWRLRHASGVLYWDTSPDGSTWTNGRTLNPAPSWTGYSGLGVLLEATRDSGTNDYAAFDNVNTPAFVSHTGAAVLTAASSLTAGGVRAVPAAAALTAASSLTGTAVRATTGAATLTAASTLTGTAVRTVPATAGLTAASMLAAAGTLGTTGTTALSAASSLSAAGITTTSGATALTAASSLVAAGLHTATGGATLTVASSLTASAGGLSTGTATLTAASALTAEAVRAAPAAAALTAASTLTAGGLAARLASAVLTAASSLTATATTPGAPSGVPRSPASVSVIRDRATVSARRPTATVSRR